MILEEEGATVHEICVLVRCGCGREHARWREIDHICALMRVANLYGNTGKEKNHCLMGHSMAEEVFVVDEMSIF